MGEGRGKGERRLLAACGKPRLPSTPTSIPPTATATESAITLPVDISKDVVYTKPLQPDVSEQKLDVYAPAEPGAWPVVVFAHGGHYYPIQLTVREVMEVAGD